MNEIFQFVLRNGYLILFGALFAHQIGFPLPGPLFLLAAGALAARGKFDLAFTITLAVTACVMADWPWYEAGRYRGIKVLHFIHRLSRDPDMHDRRAKKTFARYGPSMLLISKFVPGLDAVAPPLAGTARTSRLRFLAFDAAGAGLYSCCYAGLGYAFSHDLERVARYMARVGTVMTCLLVGALCIFAARKLFDRFNSMRSLQVAPSTSLSEGNLVAEQHSSNDLDERSVVRGRSRR